MKRKSGEQFFLGGNSLTVQHAVRHPAFKHPAPFFSAFFSWQDFRMALLASFGF
jgi:hypothetical protein